MSCVFVCLTNATHETKMYLYNEQNNVSATLSTLNEQALDENFNVTSAMSQVSFSQNIYIIIL